MPSLTRRRALAALLTVGGLLSAAGGTWLAVPPDLARCLDAPASPRLFDRHGALLHAGLAADETWRLPVALDAISPHLVRATIAAEDQRFYAHHGVDPWAVLRAGLEALRRGGPRSGASTIPMQLAKRSGGSTRTPWGKALQMLRAVRLDAHAAKDELIAAYLNTAPYGMNLAGCEAASRRYFGKGAAQLAVHEAALLAGLPKAPTRLMPLAHPEAARARRDHVLRRMRGEGLLSEAGLREALDAPHGAAWHDFPRGAPHLAQLESAALAGGGAVQATVDGALQRRVQALVTARVRALGPDITNGACVVVDVPSGAVRAWVGSQGFFDTPGGGQVDLCRAPRSPGSALKPFVYAAALERSALYPDELLYDGNWDAGGYRPENFDREFLGLAPAGDALRRSLNIPAVTVLQRVGVPAFQRALEGLGMDTLGRAPESYGLGLTLGNCEVRLDQLARAYATLARMGIDRPLSRVQGDAQPGERRLSAGVCLAVVRMLEQALPGQADATLLQPNAGERRAAWKTGTSAGNRDAWAVVFDAQHVAAVWLGNNDGRPSPRLIGARTALPLAAHILEELPGGAAWNAPPGALRTVRVCARSGLPLGPACPHSREAALPATQFLHRTCTLHYRGAAGEVRTQWPASAAGWDLAALDATRPAAPDAGPPGASDAPADATALRILSPVGGGEYVLSGEPEGDRVPLRSSAPREATVHWYADGQYLGAAAAGTALEFALTPGPHRIACAGPGGARDEISIRVLTVAELRMPAE